MTEAIIVDWARPWRIQGFLLVLNNCIGRANAEEQLSLAGWIDAIQSCSSPIDREAACYAVTQWQALQLTFHYEDPTVRMYHPHNKKTLRFHLVCTQIYRSEVCERAGQPLRTTDPSLLIQFHLDIQKEFMEYKKVFETCMNDRVWTPIDAFFRGNNFVATEQL